MMIFPNFQFGGICMDMDLSPWRLPISSETKQPNKSGALMLDNLSATERAVEAARWSGFFETVGWLDEGMGSSWRWEKCLVTPWKFNSLPLHIGRVLFFQRRTVKFRACTGILWYVLWMSFCQVSFLQATAWFSQLCPKSVNTSQPFPPLVSTNVVWNMKCVVLWLHSPAIDSLAMIACSGKQSF